MRKMFLLEVAENRWFMRQALDEIQRLRGILGREHARSCGILRDSAECDCGLKTEAQNALIECWTAKADKERLEVLVAHHQREIARLDGVIARERAERFARGTAPQPVVQVSQPTVPAPRVPRPPACKRRSRATLLAAATLVFAFAGCRVSWTDLRETHDATPLHISSGWNLAEPPQSKAKQSPSSTPALPSMLLV